MAQHSPDAGKKTWRYRLALVNERKEKKVFSLSMPVWVVAMLTLLLSAMAGLLAIIIVVRTPLKAYLPGYLDVTQRSEMIGIVMRLDSLEHESRLRSAYLHDFIATLRQSELTDSVIPFDSAAVIYAKAELPAATARDSAFRERYELGNRYDLTARSEGSAPTFMPPASGSWQDGRLRLVARQTVLSPFEGTVVCADFLPGEGFRLVLQHTGDYIVVLTHLTDCQVAVGETLRAGSALGTAGTQQAEADRWIGLQLWYKGRQLNPPTLIQF